MSDGMGQAALALAARGRHVFPLHTVLHGRCSCGCADPTCTTRGKHPLFGGGHLHASTDAALIRDWWGNAPDANIGLQPGRSNLIAFDIDNAAAEAVAASLGLLSEPTLTVRTCRPDFPGAAHLYFQRPTFDVGNVTLVGALTVRCDHGYTVAPPSLHYSGRRYTVLVRATTRPLPADVLDALRRAHETDGSGGRVARDIPRLPVIPEGQRHDTLVAYAGRLAAKGFELEEGFQILRGLNLLLARPPYPEGSLWQDARDIWEREAKKHLRQDAPDVGSSVTAPRAWGPRRGASWGRTPA